MVRQRSGIFLPHPFNPIMFRPILLALLTVACFPAQSQVRFGNRAGAAWLKQVLQPSAGYAGQNFMDRKMDGLGFTSAITLELPLARTCMLNLEAGYAERGYGRGEDRPGAVPMGLSSGDRIRTRHAGLSILPKARIGNKALMLEVFGGLDVSWAFAISDQHAAGILIWEAGKLFQQYPAPFRADLLAPLQFSAVCGAGIALRAGAAMVHLNARYVRGLSNVYATEVAFTDPQGYPFGTGKVYDRSLALTLGYSIPLSAKTAKTPEK